MQWSDEDLAFVLFFVTTELFLHAIICYALYNSLKAVPEQHRKLRPKQVWLLFIPLFHLYWFFVVLSRIPMSYQSYFQTIGRRQLGVRERSLGIWLAICIVLIWVPIAPVPVVGFCPGIVLLLVYLSKLARLNQLLKASLVAARAVPPARPVTAIPRPRMGGR